MSDQQADPNPYQPPDNKPQLPTAATPGPASMIGATILALFFGGLVFIASCFGGTLFLIGIGGSNVSEAAYFFFVWGGSALLAAVVARWSLRRLHQRARGKAVENEQESAEEES